MYFILHSRKRNENAYIGDPRSNANKSTFQKPLKIHLSYSTCLHMYRCSKCLSWCNTGIKKLGWWNTGKKYYSAVPHENSAFKNFIHTCLMLNSENISYILCKISHLLQSIAIIRHVSAQTPMPKRTISHRRLLFVHYPL